MSKRLLILIFSLALVVSACAPSRLTEAPPTTQPADSPTGQPVTQPVSATATEASAPATEQVNLAEPGCTMTSRQPTPGPTQQSILPPIGENDWSLGPEDAYVTIIEYSDFQ